jgi:hypothetical protein
MPGTYFAMRGSCAASGPTKCIERLSRIIKGTEANPTIAIATSHLGPDDVFVLWVSSFFGVFIPMGWVTWQIGYPKVLGHAAMPIWIAPTSAIAYAILRVTIVSFDRLLGRMTVVRSRIMDVLCSRFVSRAQPR